MPRGSVPATVERYAAQIRAKNPLYSEAAVWATAWSIYCKYKAPSSRHCKKRRGEYLTSKSRRRKGPLY